MKPNLHHQAENSSFSVFSSYYYCDDIPYSDGIHFHMNYEIISIMEKSCCITYKNLQYTLNAGEAILIEPFIQHSIELSSGAKVRSCVFNKLLFYSLANIIDGYHPQTPIFKPSKEVLQYYDKELMKAFGTSPSINETLTPEIKILIKGCLYAIGSEFIRQVKLIPAEKNNDTLIQQILDHVSANFKSDISLRDIAHQLGYSYHYLSRIFNNTLGINFKSLLNICRMEYAIPLLEYSQTPIGDIAYKSGFQNLRSFNNNCKLIYGKTPRDIRKTSQHVAEA